MLQNDCDVLFLFLWGFVYFMDHYHDCVLVNSMRELSYIITQHSHNYYGVQRNLFYRVG
jgi:hypothetical protein